MDDSQRLAIYMAILSQVSWLKHRLLVDQTNTCETLGSMEAVRRILNKLADISRKSHSPRIDEAIIASFIANSAVLPMPSALLQMSGVRTLPAEYLLQMTYKLWDKYYSDFKENNGFVSFSNIGTDRSGNSALVYGVSMSGPTGGGGYFYHLHCTNESWQVVRHYGVIDY